MRLIGSRLAWRSALKPAFPRPRASVVAILVVLVGLSATSAQAQTTSEPCADGRIATGDGCLGAGSAGKRVVEIVRAARARVGLKAVIARVDVGGRPLLTKALGESHAGAPATRRMHFRIGSMAIPYLTNVLLQLEDEGRLSLDDKLSRWFPGNPNAERISLRMLANNTSGYPDWIQGNQAFVDAFYADVFRQWTPDELIGVALERPLACEPGACFTYAHTNYAILAKVLRRVAGEPVRRLIRNRILSPLGLRETAISRLPAIPTPVLHAYSSDRGPYEDSTFWSPSWTLGSGSIMTGTIADVARSARALGRGRLLSRRAARQMFAATTANLPGMSEELYYGLGILVAGGWRMQNPMLNGYTGVMAYLPSKEISVALTVTNGERASHDDRSHSEALFEEIAAFLAPEHAVDLPG